MIHLLQLHLPPSSTSFSRAQTLYYSMLTAQRNVPLSTARSLRSIVSTFHPPHLSGSTRSQHITLHRYQSLVCRQSQRLSISARQYSSTLRPDPWTLTASPNTTETTPSTLTDILNKKSDALAGSDDNVLHVQCIVALWTLLEWTLLKCMSYLPPFKHQHVQCTCAMYMYKLHMHVHVYTMYIHVHAQCTYTCTYHQWCLSPHLIPNAKLHNRIADHQVHLQKACIRACTCTCTWYLSCDIQCTCTM